MLRFRFACFDELFICPVYINCTLVIYVLVFGNLEFINVVKVRTYDILYIELNVYNEPGKPNTGYNSFGNFMKCFGRIPGYAFMSYFLYQRYCKALLVYSFRR